MNRAAVTTEHDRRLGYFFGFVGVASFSLTLPATRRAPASIEGGGRAA